MAQLLNQVSGSIKFILMKKIFLLLLVLFSLKLFSQEKALIKDFNKIHQEKIFIHLNANFLLTGETLLYKLSCLHKLSNKYSQLSKIIYIEIINDKKERVELQKINLIKGKAQGDFFIRNSLKSGNYKVISYTKWMKNKNLFTASDLYIINPFQTKIKKSTDAITLNTNNYQTNSVNTTNNAITLSKKKYSKREKVSFKINLGKANISSNNLSLSVRKIDNQFYSKKKNSSAFLQEKNPAGVLNSSTNIIPDLRGDVLKGQITSKSIDKSVENIKISLSIIQKNGFSLISNTDKNGYFYFILDDFRTTERVYFQLIDANINDYKITLDKEHKLNFDHLSFKKLNTNNLLDTLIDKRSTYIQVENAYKNLKRDQIILEKSTGTFTSANFKNYKLDNFTRFKTMKETMVEVIPYSGISTSKGEATFHVNQTNSQSNSLPMLLIDGLIIKNHNELASLKMSLVDEIDISHHVFKFNSILYKGVISVNTYSGEYEPKSKELFSINLQKPLPNKKYYFANYSIKKDKITPDFRTQLYWEPNLNSIQNDVTFYTSDVSGVFEINIEGFSNTGKPISLKQYFKVE